MIENPSLYDQGPLNKISEKKEKNPSVTLASGRTVNTIKC